MHTIDIYNKASLARKDIKYEVIASHRSVNTFLNKSDNQIKSWCLTQLT